MLINMMCDLKIVKSNIGPSLVKFILNRMLEGSQGASNNIFVFNRTVAKYEIQNMVSKFKNNNSSDYDDMKMVNINQNILNLLYLYVASFLKV